MAAATARCFFSERLDALGAEADERYWAMEDGLHESLTVGRPISGASPELQEDER